MKQVQLCLDLPFEDVDKLIINELKDVATYVCDSWHPDDKKLHSKLRKKARWLLKNWYLTKEEWEAFYETSLEGK